MSIYCEFGTKICTAEAALTHRRSMLGEKKLRLFLRFARFCGYALLPAVAAVLTAGCGDSSSSLPCGSGEAEDTSVTYVNNFGSYRALVHVPKSYRSEAPMPLVVNLHGCNRTAEEQLSITQYNVMADREEFIVIYADYDGAANTTHPLSCWRFYEPLDWQRNGGDPDGVAGLTRAVMDRWSVDPSRVYLVGSSSGGFMTSILGATYPELFAAIAVIAGGPYASTLLDALQPVGPRLVPVANRAELAHAAMGENSRVVPVLAMHGDQDTTVYPQNGVNAIQQWLMTNNLVVTGAASGPFPLTPTTVESGLDTGGASFERQDFRSADGCLIARHVLIHGQEHGWPGRTEDSLDAPVVDPLPMGTRMSWDFFKNFTKKSGAAIPCRSVAFE